MHEREPGCGISAAGGPSGRCLLGCAAAAAVLLVAGGCAGSGERELPSSARVMGRPARERTRLLAVDTLGDFLGAGYLFTREDHTGSAQERIEHLAQERAGVGAAGSIYSPAFLRYEATGVAGFSQDWARDATSSSSDTGELYESDVGAYLFPERFHPASLHYSRLQDFQPRVFFSQIESTTTTARGTQNFNFEDFSLHLDALRREQEQTVFGAEEQEPFADVTENTLGASAEWALTEFQTATGSYQYQDVSQSAAENSFTAHNVLATHTWFLTSDKEHELRSRVEGVSQDGSLDQELLRLDEQLNSHLLEHLWGDANFRYEQNDTNILEQEIFQGGAGLRHQLYESLASALRVQAQHLTTDSRSITDTFGGGPTFNYQKKTPLGVLRINYAGFFERRIVENDQGGAIDEPHTFPAVPPEEVRLLQTGVDPASIVVTDPTGFTFYREGLDYTVREDAAGVTTLVRVFAGTIPPGGDILVDYLFRLGTDFTLDTLSQNASVEHEFHGGLTPFFRAMDQDQEISDVQGPGGIEPIIERSLVGGLEWRHPELLLGAEYENRESTVLPFDAVRLRAQGAYRVAARHQATFNATQSWLFYREPERDVQIFQGNARWRSDLTRTTNLYLDGAFRHDDDSLQGESFGFALGGGLETVWRKFTMRLRAAYRETRGVTSDFRGIELGVFIVREFGSLPPTTSSARNRFLRQ